MSEEQHIVQMSDGAKLHVWLTNRNTSDKKPLLIVLHGAPGFSSHLEPLSSFGFLTEKFRLLVYDARGSGQSDLKGPYTNDRWVADVDELREWAGADSFFLAGGSYGGFLALEYVLAHPDRVRALILRDTAAFGARLTLQVLASILTSKRINAEPDRQVRLWSGTLRDKAEFIASVEEILPIYKPENNSEGERSFEGVGTHGIHFETQNAAFSYNVPRYDVRHRLHEIKVPTLVVVGRQDVICTVEESEEIHHGIPNSELAVFENSGHSPPSDEPEEFRRKLSPFINSLGY